MDTANGLLEIQNLSVAYAPAHGAAVRALSDLSLQARPGEIFGILGESGCGKSTLAHTILGLLPARSKCHGQIFFRDRDLLLLRDRELNELRGRDLALIPQNPATSLNPAMKVGTQIGEVLRAHLALTTADRRTRVHELLHEMDLELSVYHAYPHQLSGGQRQRIVIAQALACRPALIIADEPTSKLDAGLRTEIVRLLSNIRAKHGTTILVITHDPTLVAGIVDRVAVMYAGRVIEIAGSAPFFRRPLHPYSQALTSIYQSINSDIGHKKIFPIVSGDPPDPTITAHGCAFEPRCADRLQVCSQIAPREITPEPTRLVRCLKYET